MKSKALSPRSKKSKKKYYLKQPIVVMLLSEPVVFAQGTSAPVWGFLACSAGGAQRSRCRMHGLAKSQALCAGCQDVDVRV